MNAPIRLPLLSLATALLLAACPPAATSQEDLRNQLFSGADTLLARAKRHQAELLAPASFRKGMGYYDEAAAMFRKGDELEEIRTKVQNASDYLAKAVDVAKAGEAAFSAALAARTDALSAGAPTQQPELWKKAEERFKRAASETEDGGAESGRRLGDESTELYRTSELEAIKSNYLSPARILIDRAAKAGADETAPKTLARARSLAAQTEEILKQNRYDTDEARELAQEARYEADHAIALNDAIEKMRSDDRNFEPALLAAEEQAARVAAALGLKARFDRGFGPPADEMVAAVKARDTSDERLRESLERATADIAAKGIELENLRAQIASMEKRVGTLTDAEKDLQAKLAAHRSQESTIRGVEGMFTSDEGHVIREGNRIIIRLYGLSFPSGKSTIEAQYYPLLTRVQDAIRRFPKAAITIEGHTDDVGTDDVNQKLSEGRSRAVAEYLMANMGVQTPIESEGYGESRPVAGNGTPEGRAKNRRIDVVITPEW